MELKPIQEFSWDFLGEISWWSLGIAAATSVAATLMTGQVTFAIACMLAASIDVAFIRAIAASAHREMEEGAPGIGQSSMLFVVRLVAKAGLLVLGILIPGALGFAGMVAGVLCYDITLAVVGSVIAATRLIRGPRLGR